MLLSNSKKFEVKIWLWQKTTKGAQLKQSMLEVKGDPEWLFMSKWHLALLD